MSIWFHVFAAHCSSSLHCACFTLFHAFVVCVFHYVSHSLILNKAIDTGTVKSLAGNSTLYRIVQWYWQWIGCKVQYLTWWSVNWKRLNRSCLYRYNVTRWYECRVHANDKSMKSCVSKRMVGRDQGRDSSWDFMRPLLTVHRTRHSPALKPLSQMWSMKKCR